MKHGFKPVVEYQDPGLEGLFQRVLFQAPWAGLLGRCQSSTLKSWDLGSDVCGDSFGGLFCSSKRESTVPTARAADKGSAVTTCGN